MEGFAREVTKSGYDVDERHSVMERVMFLPSNFSREGPLLTLHPKATVKPHADDAKLGVTRFFKLTYEKHHYLIKCL